MKLGSDSGSYMVEALIVPDIPTECMFEVPKLEQVALLELTKVTGESIKIRNLK